MGRPCRYSYSAPARAPEFGTLSKRVTPYVSLLQSLHGMIRALGLSCIPLVYKAGQTVVIAKKVSGA
jgi:hypothetical protein